MRIQVVGIFVLASAVVAAAIAQQAATPAPKPASTPSTTSANPATTPPATPAPQPATTQQATPEVSSAPAGPLKSASLGLVPYPAKQQPAAQQSKDDQECFDWSKQSTGIDPAQPVPVEQTAATQPQKGTRAKGAVKGAAAGAVVGGVVDDKAGEGAGIGAAAGAIRSGRQEKAQVAGAQKEAEAQAQSTQAARLDTFRKGYAACMETRGYAVK